MTERRDPVIWIFDRIILKYPIVVLVGFAVLLGILGYYATHFRIEASAETLLQQDDEHYLFYQKTIERYGFEDFVVIAYTPVSGDILDDDVLSRIARLRDEIEALSHIDSVLTILDVPLLESPPRPLQEIIGDIRTLGDPGVDKQMAREELRTSPLYENLLVSEDLKTTALQINFKPDVVHNTLWEERQRLRQKMVEGELTPKQKQEFSKVTRELDEYRAIFDRTRHRDIENIRDIMAKYEENAELYLGGVSVIADDLMRFIQNDLRMFSGGVLAFLIIALGLIFHRVRWVLLPIVCCVFSVIAMIGLLGFFQWPVTIVSANFVALQLIITMAVSIHLVVRYRELIQKHPKAPHRQLTRDMVDLMKTPIFYAGLTTIAGFGSLLLADIKPVVTFGLMMSGGIVMSLLVTLIVFPASLVLFRKLPPPAGGGSRLSLTRVLARFTEGHGRLVIAISALALIMSAAGIAQLRVENSFINYFKPSTDIYKGLKVIDQKLGGTTPLDVIIDFGSQANAAQAQTTSPETEDAVGEDDFGEFEEFEARQDTDKYWFTRYRLDRIEMVHDYLQQHEHSGKVLSLAILYKVAQRITGGQLDSFELSLLFNEFPKEYRKIMVDPFVSIEHDQTRLNLRVKDANESLRRNEFINDVREDLTHELGLEPENVNLTGMLLLYNDVLQRLFDSQIRTLGVVLAALMVMFLILFRSLKISLIAIFPNLLAIMMVLGTMGWLDIPLDIMTITIASISVGIAVDNTIHYIHRFKKEICVDWNYIDAMHRCHNTIGYAMYYTSLTIVAGFAILALSNFIPTIIFGLFTGLAMFIALIASLTLLPKLIILIKPFGPEGGPDGSAVVS